jgi:hypothetical protein
VFSYLDDALALVERGQEGHDLRVVPVDAPPPGGGVGVIGTVTFGTKIRTGELHLIAVIINLN